MTDEQTLRLSKIFNGCLLDLESVGNFDLRSGDREQAMQVLMDAVESAVNIMSQTKQYTAIDGTVGTFDEVFERNQQELLRRNQPSIDVEIGKLEDRVVEVAIERRRIFRQYGYETETPSRLDDATLQLDIAADLLLQARAKAESTT